jgi:hypothetical protein
MGVGATLCIDLWASFLRLALGVRSLDYCLLGRWVLHMRRGTFRHASIGLASAEKHECRVGWAAHYSIGVGFALVFVLLAGEAWIQRPTLPLAAAFGALTVTVPFFTMQPAFGLGVASSRTKNPGAARLKSVVTHSIFGAGLFVSAYLLNRALG